MVDAGHVYCIVLSDQGHKLGMSFPRREKGDWFSSDISNRGRLNIDIVVIGSVNFEVEDSIQHKPSPVAEGRH